MRPIVSREIKNLNLAAELILQARHAVALTGAGISTPSGIPDFRSEGTGLWAKSEKMEFATLTNFRYEPHSFYAGFRPLANQIFKAEPNPAHLALAKLEKAEYLKTIITQNIDILHQKAGSKNVIEMHGTLRFLTCTQCYQTVESEPFIEVFVRDGKIPYCKNCGAILKPNIILFGEQLPQKAWYQAQKTARQADLMLVIGSSLEVLPVAGLPMQMLDRGGHLIIINQVPTYLDIRADLVFTQNAEDILPALAEKVLNRGN